VDLTWQLRTFGELTAAELYAILALRQQVFVVEQKCCYQDADGLDRVSRHLWAHRGDGLIAAYLRIVPAGAKFAEVSIGRVLTAPQARGTGLGRELMERGIAAVGNVPLRISAQSYLEKFYIELGFTRVSDVYDDDGIPHIDMTR